MLTVVVVAGAASAKGLLRVEPSGVEGDLTVLSLGPVEAGQFELVFTRRAGGISAWYDLDRDPRREHNLTGHGGLPNVALLSHALVLAGRRPSEVLYSAPAEKITVLEDNRVRVRIRLVGFYNGLRRAEPFRPGAPGSRLPSAPSRRPRIPFEVTYTIYPTGQLYVSQRVATRATTLRVVDSKWVLSVAPTSQFRVKGTPGSGEPPSRSDFVLHSAAGPVLFADALLVPWRGGRPVGRWGERFMVGAEGKGATRSTLQMHPAGALLGPEARPECCLLQIEPDWLDSADLAQVLAEAYQRPPAPVMRPDAGELLRGVEGDENLDGFSEAQGCYLMRATRAGCGFSLDLSQLLLMRPAFRVSGWQGSAPASILVNGKRWRRGEDFEAVLLDETTLLVQLYRNLTGGRVEVELRTGAGPLR